MAQHAPGMVIEAGPLVRRILAPNPSPFTYTGTWTHLVGRGEVAVIDPGPDMPNHVEALAAALAGERIAAILVTHNHRDHSPAARALKAATGAPIVGCAPIAPAPDGAQPDAAFDPDHAPDRVLADGESIEGDGWTLEAIATPGHTSNHLCFALPEAQALFSGDHVMGWSTTIVSPPDGDMAAYMASLAKLRERDETIYFPAHGAPVPDPKRLVRGLIGHRRSRERQIVRQIESGNGTIPEMVARMYAGLAPDLLLAAKRSVLAHLLDLEARGAVRLDGERWTRA